MRVRAAAGATRRFSDPIPIVVRRTSVTDPDPRGDAAEPGREGSGGPPWLLLAQEFVHARFREGVSLSGVAASVGVAPSHLAREFRAHFGTTVGEYARHLRVEWVAEQLDQTTTSLSEIGIAGGFSDQSHLTREFRRRLGVTPAEWKRQRGPLSGEPRSRGL